MIVFKNTGYTKYLGYYIAEWETIGIKKCYIYVKDYQTFNDELIIEFLTSELDQRFRFPVPGDTLFLNLDDAKTEVKNIINEKIQSYYNSIEEINNNISYYTDYYVNYEE
jgi:hypothetical protein